MKIKIKETTEKEIEVELPYYTSNGSTHVKADKEIRGFVYGITCSDYITSGVVRIDKGIIPDNWLLYPQITKEEFEEKFNEVLKLIQDEIK